MHIKGTMESRQKPTFVPATIIGRSVQSLSRVRLFVTLWTAPHQASLSITNSRGSPKPMSIESVTSNHLILCHPLLLQPSIFLDKGVLKILNTSRGNFPSGPVVKNPPTNAGHLIPGP